MPRHQSRIKKLARLKAAAEQTPYKTARNALLDAGPAGRAAVPERFTAPAALAAVLRARPVIGVVSAANGAGVSVLAANLVLALAGEGRRVLVLDTERAELSLWPATAAVLQALSGTRITAVQVSYQPYLPVVQPWDDSRWDWSEDDPRWDLPDPELQFDPDAVPQLAGDGGRLLPLEAGLVDAHDTVVIDASQLGGHNFAGDLLAGYAGALVTPLQLRIDQFAPRESREERAEDEVDEDGGDGGHDAQGYGGQPRLGEPYPASEVVCTLLRSSFTVRPAHLPGIGLSVVQPPANDDFRLDPGFPAVFDRLMAQSGTPVLGPWIPRLARSRVMELALAEPGGPAAVAYRRLAQLLRARAA